MHRQGEQCGPRISDYVPCKGIHDKGDVVESIIQLKIGDIANISLIHASNLCFLQKIIKSYYPFAIRSALIVDWTNGGIAPLFTQRLELIPAYGAWLYLVVHSSA